ncbi:MAG TPA: hypothetical protein VK095_16290 [Beutenbergiaceae bacterium]|nr:hypothetical protein [Beutenbergiaceae bacterium]
MSTHPADQPAPSRIPILVTAIVALLAGALVGIAGGYVIFGGTTASGDDADLARSNMEHGCALAERIEENYTDEDDFGAIEEDPVYWEGPAAGYLLVAASLQDPAYEHFHDPGSEVIHNISTLNTEELTTEAARLCAEE